MRRFPIVSLALWAFVLGGCALLLWGSSQMSSDLSSRALRRDPVVAAAGAAPLPAQLPDLSAIDFDAVRTLPPRAVRGEADASTPGEAEAGRQLVVVPEALNVRTQPNNKAERVAAVKQGERVDVLSTEGKWSQTRTASGATGWAFTQYLAEP